MHIAQPLNTASPQCYPCPVMWPSLQAKGIASQHGIPTISPNLHAYMSRALEAHMGDLMRRAYVIARQRSDVGRRMPAMEVGQRTLPFKR